MINSINLENHPVFLISAEAAGCGSTSLSNEITTRLETDFGQPVHQVAIGQLIRDQLGVTNETELQLRLDEVDDPRSFDPQIYGGLPDDRVVIVDGKLATTYGPLHIPEGREVVSIDIGASSLISAARVLARERSFLGAEPAFADDLTASIKNVERRKSHDVSMRETAEEAQERRDMTKLYFDTGLLTPQEIADKILGDNDASDRQAPEWEVEALQEAFIKLQELRYRGKDSLRPEDGMHFDHQMESIRYNIDRLRSTVNPKGLRSIREDLKTCLIDCWFGLMMKKIPRFNSILREDKGGETTEELVVDTESHAWSPEFYKIAEGWPTIKAYLEGKDVLDPYAGSGEMMNLLVARGVVNRAVYSDLLYTYDESGKKYMPMLNTEAGRLLFDSLPSWYKPDFTPIAGYVAADSKQLPLKDKSVDYVFGDPPYGKNLPGPGIGVLLGSLNEIKRVSREGMILLVPVSWIKDLEAAGERVEQLTKDLSNGSSGYPVCYIRIDSKE